MEENKEPVPPQEQHEKVPSGIEIAPVTLENVDEAINLIHTIFPTMSEDEYPDIWLRNSINPDQYAGQRAQYGIRESRYFTATKDNTVIGTTGLYELADDPEDTTWLGFYCVDPKERGKGYGGKILSWTIDKARQEGKSHLKLYTAPEESPEALEVYRRYGFEKVQEDEKEGVKIEIYDLDLTKGS